jgi:heme/copper-type cytochrome/quinol oxidase subunit 2
MNALNADSEPARRIALLGWFMIVLAAIVFLGVALVLSWAVARNRYAADRTPDLTPRGRGWIIFGGALMPALVLATIFVVATSTLGMFPVHGAPSVLVVHVTGRQWWWQIDYLGPNMQPRLTTANELHIPVGKPVRVLLTSADVIHSFWVPKLQGKLDLIPGDTNDLRLRAERVGAYLSPSSPMTRRRTIDGGPRSSHPARRRVIPRPRSDGKCSSGDHAHLVTRCAAPPLVERWRPISHTSAAVGLSPLAHFRIR